MGDRHDDEIDPVRREHLVEGSGRQGTVARRAAKAADRRRIDVEAADETGTLGQRRPSAFGR